MPYFIDRHELNGVISAETIAQKHLNDLKIQHQYNCRKLSYWFDEKQKTAFCLFEAPNRDCVEQMHKHEHDNVHNRIVEISYELIERFLKHIELHTETQEAGYNGIAPHAITTVVMALSIDTFELHSLVTTERQRVQKQYKNLVLKYCEHFSGTIFVRDNYASQLTFSSVPEAVNCALKIHKEFTLFVKSINPKLFIKVGISGCFYGKNSPAEFQDSAKLAKRLCYISKSKILVTLQIKNLFQSESMKVVIKGDRIKSISPDDIRFITFLMDYMEKHWKNHDLRTPELESHLGYSKSQIYRKMKMLIDQSTNSFIKEYRLNRAKELLRNKSGNISEIAFDTGFSSPSYFTKCFQREYGIKPSDFLTEDEIS